jgi:hypothetical protein
MAGNGMGAAWERHGMCELTFIDYQFRPNNHYQAIAISGVSSGVWGFNPHPEIPIFGLTTDLVLRTAFF